MILDWKLKHLLSFFGAILTFAIGGLVGVSLSTASTTVSGKKLESGIEQVMSGNFRAVFVTTPSLEVAKKIAHGLVSNRFAACVNIIPQITSVYEWEGKVNEDSELLLMIKTESNKLEEIEKFVKENHPYTVPEVIAVPIEQGSENYFQWIRDTLRGGAQKS